MRLHCRPDVLPGAARTMITAAIWATITAFFCAGCVITALTGSTRGVKILFGWLTAMLVVLLAAGFWLSRGLLIFLLFQIVALILVLYLITILGAVCGGGIYSLRHAAGRGKHLDGATLGDYVELAEFCALEHLEEERAIARINSGYYRGGRHGGNWYIHRSELTGT
jgi:hypothetical protein